MDFTTSPGGWVLDFTRLMQSHLPTKVEVEVEDELGKSDGCIRLFKMIVKE